MTTSLNSNQKPGLFTAVAVMTLVSGIVNVFWGFIFSMSVLSTIIGVVCVPITILPTILGVFEIIYAAKLLTAQPQPVQPAQNLAAFEIAAILYGNAFSLVVGILALVFYNDLTVKEYFRQLNSSVAIPEPLIPLEAESPAPVEPALPSTPPVPTEPDVPQPEEPEKPKRIRKVAK